MSALALYKSTTEYVCPVWYKSAYTKHVDVILNKSYRIIPRCLNPTSILKNEDPSSEPTSPLMGNKDDSNILHLFPTKKKMKSHDEISENIHSFSEVDKVIHFLQSKKSHPKQMDRLDCWFLNYATTFKTFCPNTQAILKLKFAKLFSETELNELQEQETSQTASPFSPSSSNEYKIRVITNFNFAEIVESYSKR